MTERRLGEAECEDPFGGGPAPAGMEVGGAKPNERQPWSPTSGKAKTIRRPEAIFPADPCSDPVKSGTISGDWGLFSGGF